MIANSLSEMCKIIATALGNHLWQSTLCALAAGLLTLILRNNHARTRYLLWLTASVKFLIPFSLLASMGSHMAWSRGSAKANAGLYMAMDQLSQPFSQTRMSLVSEAAPALHSPGLFDVLPAIVAVVWLCGIAVVVLACYLRWRRISAVMSKAVPLREGREVEFVRRLERAAGMSKKIEMRMSRTSLEPGIFGIVRPILVWPQGISERLENEHLEAILAHELCHVRRRDNLSATLHMAVEAIFWFHPMVWWLGARLVEERERACDEQVLELGSDRQVYAESILKICEFCVAFPLGFVSGVTGADLKKRIVNIMAKNSVRNLDFSRKLLLSAAGLAAVAMPVAFGVLTATQGRAQSQAQITGAIPPVYEAVSVTPTSVKPDNSGAVSSRMVFHTDEFLATKVTLQELMRTIYRVEDNQIAGAPSWFKIEKFDIEAKWDKSVLDALQTLSQDQLARERKRMVEDLLADRFKLTLHRETQHLPLYELVVANNGPKLHEAKPGGTYPDGFKDADGRARAGMMHMERGRWIGQGVPVALLVKELSRELSRGLGGSIIEDKTGLLGNYDFKLQWTPEESRPSIFRGSDSTPAPESSSPSLFSALPEQLGLKLELQNGPGEILVIDHVEEPADPQAQKTYARAPVFQAASVTPNKSSNSLRAITAESRELKITNFTLRMLILRAYGVQGFQLSGGPDWLDSESYDIEAKMDSAEAQELGKLSLKDRSLGTLRLLQSLLADRFNLSLHRETEQIPVYALVIARGGPKVREATPGDTYPNGITGLHGRPIGGGGISEPERGKLVGQGCPIAYLVDALSQEEFGLGRVVLNKTGLAGNYDFTLQWTPAARKGSLVSGPAKFNNYGEFFDAPQKNKLNASAEDQLSDSSRLSVFTAIQEQLGLKLESQTRPVEILVIDHAEKPSEN
jgi:bla regulator protein BlaR1